MDWRSGIRICFSLHQNAQKGSGAHPASYSVGTEVLNRMLSVRGVQLTLVTPN